MHREGHVGAALLFYAPVGFITAALGFQTLAFIGGVGAAGLAMVPDFDMRVPFVKHRGPTHTLWFILLGGTIGLLLGGIAGLTTGLVAVLGLAVFSALVITLTLASHIAADALTPMGVQPFTPASSRKITLGIAKASNPIANYVLLGLGGAEAILAVAGGIWIQTLLA